MFITNNVVAVNNNSPISFQLNAIHFEYPDDLSQRAGHIGQNKFVHPVVNGPQKGDGLQVEKFSDTGSKEQSRTGRPSEFDCMRN